MTILNMIIPTENLAENNVKIASLNCNGFKSNRHYIERLKKKKRREDYVTTVILGDFQSCPSEPSTSIPGNPTHSHYLPY